MRSQRWLILFVLFFIAMMIGFIFSSLGPIPPAHAATIAPPHASSSAIAAAPSVTYTLYLPLIFRNACSATQLIQNSGFETVPNTVWQTKSISSTIIDNSAIPIPNPTHSGAWKAFLGGSNLAQESLWQNITVPAGTTSLTLSFWRRIDTDESFPSTNDSLQIQIRNTVSTTLQTVYTLYDGDASATWVQDTKTISPTYASQTIQLAFIATTDVSFPTSFFIDDVTVSACH